MDGLIYPKNVLFFLSVYPSLKQQAYNENDTGALDIIFDFETKLNVVIREYATANQLEIIKMIVVDGLSQREIGEIRGISQQGVQAAATLFAKHVSNMYREEANEFRSRHKVVV